MTIDEIKQALADMGDCNMRAVGNGCEIWAPLSELVDFPKRFFKESEIMKMIRTSMTAEELRAIRKRLGMRQVDFAEAIGRTRDRMKLWENKHVEVPQMAAMAIQHLSDAEELETLRALAERVAVMSPGGLTDSGETLLPAEEIGRAIELAREAVGLRHEA
jgi:DNA-binding transcriptional regulator YiaG